MPNLTITKTYADNQILSEVDLDNIKNDVETFMNTTKLDSVNIQTGGILAANLATDSVETLKIKGEAVTAAKINADVAGDGLGGVGGTALSVNVDDSTIEISADTIQVKALGIGTAQIAAQSVDSTKLATDSVTTGSILAASVTAAKLANDSVTTGSILANNVSQGKMAIKVSGAGTGKYGFSSPVGFATTSVTFVSTGLSQAISTHGSPVSISLQGGTNSVASYFELITTTAIPDAFVEFEVRNNSGGIVQRWAIRVQNNIAVNPDMVTLLQIPAGYTFLDIPGSGTTTYTLFARGSSAGIVSAGISDMRMFIYEIN